MRGQNQSIPGLAVATVAALAACGPLTPSQGVTAADARATRTKPPAAAPLADEQAAEMIGKVKEPVGLARQSAFITSLHDALPVNIASGGMGTLSQAGSLVSNNGGNLISNNGGGLISDKGLGLIGGTGGAWRLLQAPLSLLPDYTQVRQDVVLRQKADGMLSAVISLYDPKTWDPAPGADNEGALIDRFRMKVVDFQFPSPEEMTFDLDLKVVTSQRIPFVDELLLRQAVKKTPTGAAETTRMEYRLGFDVKLADGTVDRAKLVYVAEAKDLAPDGNASGSIGVSFEPRRMDVTGTNGHGTYTGEAAFPPGGAILGSFIHTRPDGTTSSGEYNLRPDGSSTHTATSDQGKLTLVIERTADGEASVEVRDLEATTPAARPEAVTVEGGVATFDFGEGTKPRARIY